MSKRLFNMFRSFIILFFLFNLKIAVHSQRSQKQNFYSLSEFGPTFGYMYYLGDLNPSKQFYNQKSGIGLMYRYNVHPRLTYRFNFLAGSVEANDSDSKNDILRNRNLSFHSNIQELSGGLEFHYYKYQLGNNRYRFTTYMIIQAGLFHFNPATTLNGDTLFLQPLGTEGQGTTYGKKRKYLRYQPSIPIGIGAKFCLGKYTNINLDIALRKTFTDYIDDVGANYNVDPNAFDQDQSVAEELSNRTLDGSRYGKRGNSSTSDWFVYYSFSITFRLGRTNKCAFPR
ncbi:MAG: DUF6089 family protein [Bacteroidota bacterium]